MADKLQAGEAMWRLHVQSATQTAMLSDPARAGSAPQLPPIGRYINPAEVAALVAFLLSPQAAAITGQDLQICGGASLPR